MGIVKEFYVVFNPTQAGGVDPPPAFIWLKFIFIVYPCIRCTPAENKKAVHVDQRRIREFAHFLFLKAVDFTVDF